jgi:crotonobetainyl-CoA:carnitine CoA-transferase CaiB-like acyl-CoA transferase
VGEHTRELLASLGYREDDVQRLITQRIVHAA